MKLLLTGHDDRYAVEQLQLSLFPGQTMEPVTVPFTGDGAVSSLHRGRIWLTAVTEITLAGKHTRAVRRMKAGAETVRLRRRLLQQCYYAAALSHLLEPPAWGALAGVRPTKLTTGHLLAGGDVRSPRSCWGTPILSPPPGRNCAWTLPWRRWRRRGSCRRPTCRCTSVSHFVPPGAPIAASSALRQAMGRSWKRICKPYCKKFPGWASCWQVPAAGFVHYISAGVRPPPCLPASWSGSWRQ